MYDFAWYWQIPFLGVVSFYFLSSSVWTCLYSHSYQQNRLSDFYHQYIDEKRYLSVILNSIYYKWIEHFFKDNGLFSFFFFYELPFISLDHFSVSFLDAFFCFSRNSHVLGLWILCGKCFLQVCLFCYWLLKHNQKKDYQHYVDMKNY